MLSGLVVTVWVTSGYHAWLLLPMALGILSFVGAIYCGWKYWHQIYPDTALGQNLSELDDTLNKIQTRARKIVKQLSTQPSQDYRKLLTDFRKNDPRTQALLSRLEELQSSISDIVLDGQIHLWLGALDVVHGYLLTQFAKTGKADISSLDLDTYSHYLQMDTSLREIRGSVSKHISEVRAGRKMLRY